MILNQVNALNEQEKSENFQRKIEKLTAELNQANVEIIRLKNDKQYSEEINNGSKIDSRSYGYNNRYQNESCEKEKLSKTPKELSLNNNFIKTSNFYDCNFNNEEMLNIKSHNPLYYSSHYDDIEYRNYDKIEQCKLKNRKSYDFYKFNSIHDKDKEEQSLKKLDEGIIEYYRPFN